MPITAENARELQLKGVAKRKENVQKLRDLADKPPEIIVLSSSPGTNSTEPFQVETLRRVRKQIEQVQDAMDNALEGGKPNPVTIRGLADALARLAEIERQLAGRPLPGSFKPSSKSPRSSPTPQDSPEPVDRTPPIVVPPKVDE